MSTSTSIPRTPYCLLCISVENAPGMVYLVCAGWFEHAPDGAWFKGSHFMALAGVLREDAPEGVDFDESRTWSVREENGRTCWGWFGGLF